MSRPFALAAILLGIGSGRLAAQVAPPGDSARANQPLKLPVRFTGEMMSTGELYGVRGIPSRRPGQSWRVSMSPQMTLFGEFSMGVSVLLSSEGSDLRQSISQLGLNPRYRWATLHLGDFSQNYSSYTVQGTRLRGAGFDLRPGILRVSAQGGQSQRTVAAGSAGQTFRRNLYAASVGVGREGASFIDFVMAKSKDDVDAVATALTDTTLLDTIPISLRPQIETRPQENLVLGTQGQLSLWARRLVLKGELGAAVITRDLESPALNPASVAGGTALDAVIPLRLSSSGDFAYRLEGETNLGRASLRGGYEYVGAGYTSLALAYLISDRKAYNAAGTLRLLNNHLNLQGQYQHQNDNLLGQKAATTNRDAIVGSASMLLSRGITTNVTAMINTIANHAPVDTFLVDSRSFALTASTSVQTSLLGKKSGVSLSYALQRTSDGNVVTRIPEVTVHNLSTSVQVTLSKAVSVAPTVSYAVTQNAATPTQRNVYLGMRAQAKVGQVRTSLAATQTFSNSRAVFGLNGQLNYAMPWQSRLSIQARHNRYAAIGNRPAFQEASVTMSLGRSF